MKNNMIIDTLYHSPTVVLIKETTKQTSPKYSFLIPLFAALAGGLIVLIGQGIDRYYKQKREDKDKLRDIYANCRRIEALMKNYYAELSYYKTAAQYRWYCTIVSIDKEKKKHYNDQHIKYNNNDVETERIIGETIAEFIGQVRKFQSLKAFDDSMEVELESIANLKYKIAKKYDKSVKQATILDLVQEDQRQLKDEYYKNLIYFKNINSTLQLLV